MELNAYAPLIARAIAQFDVTDLLAYGQAPGLFQSLVGKVEHRMRLQAYEPGSEILERRLPPKPAQMVACIDVLQALPAGEVDEALDDLRRCVLEIGFIKVATVNESNDDAEFPPAHWWLPKILARFELQTFQKTQDGFFVLVSPLITETERIDIGDHDLRRASDSHH